MKTFAIIQNNCVINFTHVEDKPKYTRWYLRGRSNK